MIGNEEFGKASADRMAAGLAIARPAPRYAG